MCSGQKIFQALTTPAGRTGTFITPPQSPWLGTLDKEFKEWGWNQLYGIQNGKDYCDMDGYQNLKGPLERMGVDYKSSDKGGKNVCFIVEHQNGEKVKKKNPDGSLPALIKQRYTGPDGKEYRATGAYSIIGVNADSGLLIFASRKSPAKAADELWVDRPRDEDFNPIPITPDQLPLLRSSSDTAWGFWNQGNKPENIPKIKYILAINIINDQTRFLFKKAMELWVPPEGQERPTRNLPYPGITWKLNGDNEGLALLDSPNGLGAAYLLLQHKRQLGGAKTITKIKIWRSEDEDYDEPNVIFYVGDDTGHERGQRCGENTVEEKVVETSVDDISMVREHIFCARL
ncbi:hypothetical protein EK21DRAFT_80594 [Setomelanomma holmii]|uniref:Uncharacterized protein n=1 Tax=Setomelanomma holmii TaxID=210430 RepID=A0A9P4LFT9_9PLEO|nr:hypothetical protein EK21DRAFT_80594 [Setomelanomma holmii]